MAQKNPRGDKVHEGINLLATDILDSADVHISVHQQTSGSRQSGFGKLQLTALCFDLDFYLHCSSGVADSHRRRIVPLHLAIIS